MYIVTGMDNSGKTTLVRRMSEELGLPVVKSMGPDHTLDEKFLWTLDQMSREKTIPGSVIYDRFLPLEEMVYGKVLRGNPIFHLNDPYMKTLKDLHPTIIYTRPSSKTIFNWDGREQMEGVIEQKEKLLAAWDDLMWGLMARGWDVQIYDYQAEKEGHPQIAPNHILIGLLGNLMMGDTEPEEGECSCDCCHNDCEEED